MAHLKAYYVAKEIPINRIKGALPFVETSITRETALYTLNSATVYIYSFGSIVFVGTSPSEEKGFIKELSKKIALKKRHFTEGYDIIKDHNAKHFFVKSSCVIVKKLEHKMLDVVARVLAQSVALESYEEEFDKTEEEFSKMNQQLAKNGKLSLSGKEVMKIIARNNLVMEEIVSGVGVLDKPDSVWESTILDLLHTKLSDEFELVERFQNLQSKMTFVQENYKVFLESLRGRNDARLEWIIIILIAIEIFLFVYQLWWQV